MSVQDILPSNPCFLFLYWADYFREKNATNICFGSSWRYAKAGSISLWSRCCLQLLGSRDVGEESNNQRLAFFSHLSPNLKRDSKGQLRSLWERAGWPLMCQHDYQKGSRDFRTPSQVWLRTCWLRRKPQWGCNPVHAYFGTSSIELSGIYIQIVLVRISVWVQGDFLWNKRV